MKNIKIEFIDGKPSVIEINGQSILNCGVTNIELIYASDRPPVLNLKMMQPLESDPVRPN